MTAAEKDYVHMYSIQDIIPCLKNLKNTFTMELDHETINANDEGVVKPIGECFIKKYFHFQYVDVGVVRCKYMKGDGEYTTHSMRRGKFRLSHRLQIAKYW